MLGRISRLRSRLAEAPDGPTAFLGKGRSPSTRKLVVCLGDSITRGWASANYVALLRARHRADGVAFVNAGINSNLAWNVLQRLDAVIACRPDAVVLLIGTNDVNATFNASWEASYRLEQVLPARPTLAWYRQNVTLILTRLQDQTDAQIAVLELPMLGEDLGSEINNRVVQYNAALREICASMQIPCLPLHESLSAMLPPGHRPPPYQGSRSSVVSAVMEHLVRHRTWDQVSASRGLSLLTDHIHLNNRAAAVVADLIDGFLTGTAPG